MSQQINTLGLSAAGLWVRRVRPAPSLQDEALCLARVSHTWNLSETMEIDGHTSLYAQVSGHGLDPTWVYLVELTGRRADSSLLPNHPLSQAAPGEDVRLLAVVQPPDLLIPGVYAEGFGWRRMLWLTASPRT